MTKFTGGGSVRASRASQVSNRDRGQNSVRLSRMSSLDNKSSKLRQERVLTRSSSSPKLNQIPEKKVKARSVDRSERRCEVPRLELDISRESDCREVRARQNKREEELSAEFLPVHDTASLRPVLSDQTQTELVLSVPTLDDDTKDLQEDDTFDMERSRDFVRANMKMVSKTSQSGRVSAVSGCESVRHKAGSVPRYLRSRQAQWAEAEARARAAVPDPDCPPGHVRLPETERQQTVDSLSLSHANLLQDLNRLPVSSDSRRVVNRRRELEENLNQLEEEIKKFSRPKVFIPVEDQNKSNDIL